jgi:hypothetical protein
MEPATPPSEPKDYRALAADRGPRLGRWGYSDATLVVGVLGAVWSFAAAEILPSLAVIALVGMVFAHVALARFRLRDIGEDVEKAWWILAPVINLAFFV